MGRLGCRAAGGFGEDAEPVATGAGVIALKAADIAALKQQHRIVGAQHQGPGDIVRRQLEATHVAIGRSPKAIGLARITGQLDGLVEVVDGLPIAALGGQGLGPVDEQFRIAAIEAEGGVEHRQGAPWHAAREPGQARLTQDLGLEGLIAGWHFPGHALEHLAGLGVKTQGHQGKAGTMPGRRTTTLVAPRQSLVESGVRVTGDQGRTGLVAAGVGLVAHDLRGQGNGAAFVDHVGHGRRRQPNRKEGSAARGGERLHEPRIVGTAVGSKPKAVRPTDMPMRTKILRTDTEVRLNDDQLAALAEVGQIITPEAWDETALTAAAKDADYILTSFFPTISAAVMDAAPNLKAIVKYGVGVDNIDIPAATARGVMVVNCPEYGSNTVADHAFALIMALARKIIPIDRATRETGWVWPSPEFRGVDLGGKTLGLIGLGAIGRAMARRAAGFGMTLIASDPYVTSDTAAEYGVTLVDLPELLARADFVSIHCILTPETRGLIGEAELRAMKQSAYLVDVSRGAIIDDGALLSALREDWIAGAGMDVFQVEPLPVGFPLFDLDNVIVTSHLAWYTEEADARLAAECMARTEELLAGETPRNLKNREALGL